MGLSKAFDTLNRDLLLAKLHAYGLIETHFTSSSSQLFKKQILKNKN